MDNIIHTFKDWQQTASKDKKNIPPYMEEFFNVKYYSNPDATVSSVMARIVNSLTSAVNEKNTKLPKYAVIIIDHDLLNSLRGYNTADLLRMIPDLVTWLVRQVNTVIRRKCIDILEKKLGTISGFATKIIFVKMLRWIGRYNDTAKADVFQTLRLKWNDALNDAVAKIGQYVLTINSCNSYEHFDKRGNLSLRGKEG